MEFSETLKPTGEQIFVILGDGLFEEKLLRRMVPIFNGKKRQLAVTKLPIIERTKRYIKKTGLAALEALSCALHLGYKIELALFLVDREHVDEEDSRIKIEEELIKWGFKVEEFSRPRAEVLVFGLRHGVDRVRLYVAVAGREKNIEEEVAQLCAEVYREEIRPAAIKRIKLKELFRRADRASIRKSFRGLAYILEALDG